jgi:hypothetical protein
LDLNDFFYFVQVVDRGGFTAAGRTLRIPKSTLSHRIQQLETNLGVRLLNRTSRRFGMTDAGREFYRHAVVMLREAELAETAIRGPYGPASGFDPSATTLATARWFLFAGTAYLDANGAPQTPDDLQKRPSLYMMRTGVAPVWRLRHGPSTTQARFFLARRWPSGNPSARAFCLRAPGVRLSALEMAFTRVLAFECCLSSLTSARVQSRRITRFLLAIALDITFSTFIRRL